MNTAGVMNRFILLACLAAPPARAGALAPVLLSPPASRLHYTVFALGMLPVQAEFGRFSGALTIDPASPATCRVQVTVVIASLHMDDPDRNRLALGPAMLDAARYPTMRFDGSCQGSRLVGRLTLHGMTHPLSMTLSRTGTHVAATGTVQRRDFGIGGLPGLVGQPVRFTLDADLPQTVAAAHLPQAASPGRASPLAAPGRL